MGLPPVACTGGRLKSCAYLSSPCYYCCWPLIAAARSSTVSCSGIGTWNSGGTAAPECMEAPRPGTSSLHPPACVHPAFPNVQAFGCGGRRDPVILVTSLGCLSSSSASASLTSFLSSGCSRHILTEYMLNVSCMQVLTLYGKAAEYTPGNGSMQMLAYSTCSIT